MYGAEFFFTSKYNPRLHVKKISAPYDHSWFSYNFSKIAFIAISIHGGALLRGQPSLVDRRFLHSSLVWSGPWPNPVGSLKIKYTRKDKYKHTLWKVVPLKVQAGFTLRFMERNTFFAIYRKMLYLMKNSWEQAACSRLEEVRAKCQEEWY